MEINILQKKVDEWIKTFGLRYFNELTNMAILSEEVGEVARIIARKYGEQSAKESDQSKDLGEELADVLFVTLCLANQTGIDLQKAFDIKMEIKEKRDKERHQNNEKLSSEIPKMELIDGELIKISGSKSISNRLLVLQKLFGNIQIENLGNAQDVELLTSAINTKSSIVDIHHAGTAMRFLTSYFAIQLDKTTILTGSDRMKERPIKPLVDALKKLGADIQYLEKEGFPPLLIKGKSLEQNSVSVEAGISSQFITSLMLIGAKLKKGLVINLIGKITSLPYLKMTLEILNQIGIEAYFDEDKIVINPFASKKEIDFVVEGDWSSASYFYSLSAISRKNIKLESFQANSYQGDSVIKEIYQEYFGVKTIQNSENQIELIPDPHFSFPKEIILDMNHCPDIAQTLCVSAAALKIPFEIKGLKTLKVKETDRLVALQNELIKLGAQTEITNQSIRLIEYTAPAEEIRIKTYEDHRMAMAFAPFSLIKKMNIENPEVVKKSYPNFWKDFYSIVG